MDWKRLLSTTRFFEQAGNIVPRSSTVEPAARGYRSEYHVDYDRVVFSAAFRRLGRKTQVHPFAVHDHTHNRLTHSVEVASVGRSLGNRVGGILAEQGLLKEGIVASDLGLIVQVACLAHDIGNPPFGHGGEEALRDWFRDPQQANYLEPLSPVERLDIQTYEGNAQGLRQVTRLEMYTDEGGMRLTAASLGALIKYPWSVEHRLSVNEKFGLYQSELPYFEAVASHLGLRWDATLKRWARHPLAWLMEAADDICYAILDLEDAVEMGLLCVEEFERLLSPLAELKSLPASRLPRQRCAILRGMAVGQCVQAVSDTFIAHHDALLAGAFPYHDLIEVSPSPIKEALTAAKTFAQNTIYHHRTKLETEIAAYPCLGTLLTLLIPAAYQWCTLGSASLSPRFHAHLQLLERPLTEGMSLYEAYLRVLDFVGNLTDNTAAQLSQRVSGMRFI